MSPFNAQGKRQTAFAALDVVPMLHEGEIEVEVDEADVEMQVFRASGAGGQHINKTSSAVRLIHKPDRHRRLLPGRAQPVPEPRPGHGDAEGAGWPTASARSGRRRWPKIRGDQQRVGFGSQIRSYVLQPYQLVKDLRTEHETGNVQGVLDGDLDPFMEAWLRWQRAVASN